MRIFCVWACTVTVGSATERAARSRMRRVFSTSILFSLSHLFIHGVDESRLIELGDEARVDDVVDGDLRHLGIEFGEKGDQRSNAFLRRVRLADAYRVA